MLLTDRTITEPLALFLFYAVTGLIHLLLYLADPSLFVVEVGVHDWRGIL